MARLLDGACDEVVHGRVLVAADLDRDPLVGGAVGGDVQVPPGHLEDRCAQRRGEADDFLDAVVLDVVEHEDPLDGHARAGRLGHRVAPRDELVARGDPDRALRTGAGDRGLLRLAGLAPHFALVGGVVRAILGLGGGALALQAAPRMPASADLRALLGALLADGAGAPAVSGHGDPSSQSR